MQPVLLYFCKFLFYYLSKLLSMNKVIVVVVVVPRTKAVWPAFFAFRKHPSTILTSASSAVH